MSETKLEVKTVGHSEKISPTSENYAFRYVCENFAMLIEKIFYFCAFFLKFFFSKSNKIINN